MAPFLLLPQAVMSQKVALITCTYRAGLSPVPWSAVVGVPGGDAPVEPRRLWSKDLDWGYSGWKEHDHGGVSQVWARVSRGFRQPML